MKKCESNTERGIFHQPVLLEQSLEALNIREDGIYMDATFGRGGHSQAILNRLGKHGRLIVMDKDAEAVACAKTLLEKDERCSVHHLSFAKIRETAEKENVFGKVNGILMDLGVSSPQLDVPERGFSFLKEGPLDMRMDLREEVSAARWINSAREEEIARVLYEYGEERYARRIARKIVEERKRQPIETTLALANFIAQAHPAWEKHKHPATRSFQAIRIFINHELEDLELALVACLEVLDKDGRLAVISFHSLEDRIVKRFLKVQTQGLPIPAHVPVLEDYSQKRMKLIGKVIRPSHEETARNVRARSAILRVGEKIR